MPISQRKKLQHFGILCSPVPGHLLPMCSLGKVLLQRGHKVTIFTLADSAPLVTEPGLNVILVGKTLFPRGEFTRVWQPLSRSRGLRTVLGAGRLRNRLAELMCHEVPALARQIGVTAFLIDQVQFYGFAIAQSIDVPFYTIACAIHFPATQDLDYPPPGGTWGYKEGSRRRKVLNLSMYLFLEFWYGKTRKVGNRLAEREGKRQCRTLSQTYSERLLITQTPELLDYPMRSGARKSFRYFGPWQLLHANAKDTRIEREKLIYCSFGTLQTGRLDLYENIFEAARYLPEFHFLISMGTWAKSFETKITMPLPKNVEVVPFVDQLEVLSKAACAITHGGVNTVTQCIYYSVPMVCIPITNDQPSMSRRIQDKGLGIMIHPKKINPKLLCEALKGLLLDQKVISDLEVASKKLSLAMEDTRWLEILET